MGLKSDIEKKSEFYKKEATKWESRILISSILLLFFILSLFILQLGQVNWRIEQIIFNSSFYLRFLITSPIIFYLSFSVKEYDKNKKLFNEYLDKSTKFSLFKELKTPIRT